MWPRQWMLVVADVTVVVVLVGLSIVAGCSNSHMGPQGPQAPMLQNLKIVVQKSQCMLRLYDGPKLVKQYPVAIGRVAGDKVCEGDCRTPEGEFYVCYKNPESKYTLSLGLSYPNVPAADRGLREGLITAAEANDIVTTIARRGKPNWYTKLGGEIMIHGAGANRTTHGCIGMNDTDVRELYPIIPEGTPVEILP